MTATPAKTFDLCERTLLFAGSVRVFVQKLPRTISNIEDVKQLVRASGSVGANYIEANEALGKKDFAMHLKIARKESKEAMYWLRLVNTGNRSDIISERKRLVMEAKELLLIFSSMIKRFTA